MKKEHAVEDQSKAGETTLGRFFAFVRSGFVLRSQEGRFENMEDEEDETEKEEMQQLDARHSLIIIAGFKSLIQFSLFYFAQYHKLGICLRGLYSLYTYDIPDLWPHIRSGTTPQKIEFKKTFTG